MELLLVDAVGVLEDFGRDVYLAVPQHPGPHEPVAAEDGGAPYVLGLDGLADDVLGGREAGPGVDGVVEPVRTDYRNPHVLASFDICI